MHRIVFVNRFYHPDESATAQLLRDLVTSLAGRGHWVRIITSRLTHDLAGEALEKQETMEGIEVHRVYSTQFGRGSLPGRLLDLLSFYVFAALSLATRLGKHDILVIKTDPPLMSVIAGPIARFRGALVVNWLQDLYPEVAAQLGVPLLRSRIGRLLRKMRNRSLRKATANVVISHGMAVHLERQGVAPHLIHVIPNWFHSERLTPLPRSANPLRSDWDLRDRFVVGYSGNLGRAHDLDTLIQVAHRFAHPAAALHPPDPGPELGGSPRDVVFLFVGGGHYRRRLERQVEDLGLENVLFKDFQPRDQLPFSLCAPDLHVVAMRPELEGLLYPSKFYGALAAGRPVLFIGDTQGEIAREIENRDIGTACRSADTECIARAILRLHRDESLRATLGMNARRVFEECYEQSLALKEWVRLIDQITVTQR